MARSKKPDVNITWRGKEFTKQLVKKLQPRLKRVGSELRTNVVNALREKKTRVHGPSAPGEVPHVDTGQLMKSIFWEMTGDLSVRVGTYLDYGKYLEEGTRRMAARPYLRPTKDKMGERIRTILVKGV